MIRISELFRTRPFKDGIEVILNQDWNEKIKASLEGRKILRLAVWDRVSNVEFVSELTAIESLVIRYVKLDLTPLYHLQGLRHISAWSEKGPKLMFSKFEKLKECDVEYTNKMEDLVHANGLTRLYVGNLAKKLAGGLSNLQELRRLTILGCATDSLESLGELNNLHFLRIARMHKLQGYEFLSSLQNLRVLQIQSCADMISLEMLDGLEKLEYLFLSGVGELSSLEPLKGLKNLRALVISGNRTKVKDLKLDCFQTFPNLCRLYIEGARKPVWTSSEDNLSWNEMFHEYSQF